MLFRNKRFPAPNARRQKFQHLNMGRRWSVVLSLDTFTQLLSYHRILLSIEIRQRMGSKYIHPSAQSLCSFMLTLRSDIPVAISSSLDPTSQYLPYDPPIAPMPERSRSLAGAIDSRNKRPRLSSEPGIAVRGVMLMENMYMSLNPMHHARRPPLPPIPTIPLNPTTTTTTSLHILIHSNGDCHMWDKNAALIASWPSPPPMPIYIPDQSQSTHYESRPTKGGPSSEENGRQQAELHEQSPTTAANVLAAIDDESFGEIGWLQARHVVVGNRNASLTDDLGGEGIEGSQAPVIHQADNAVPGHPITLLPLLEFPEIPVHPIELAIISKLPVDSISETLIINQQDVSEPPTP